MPEKNAPHATSRLAVGLIVALIVVNLLLIKQNLGLRKELSASGEKIEATADSLKSGESVAPLTGTDLNGQPFDLAYKQDGRQRLLLFFSPNCPYCVQQAAQWRNLLNSVDNNRFSVIGIVSDREGKSAVVAHAEVLGYFKTKTPLPVVFVNGASLARYKLMATPTTLLINNDGKVEHAWVGKWDEVKAGEVAVALK